MTKKGYCVLKHVIEKQPACVKYVVVATDPNIENDFSNEIIQLARKAKILCYTRGNEPPISSEEYVFSISWRWIINHPKEKLIVFHDSLLPKYRGFAPLVNMLIKGERRIGVTALFGSKTYDEGDIILQASSDINYPITISEAIDLNIQNYIELINILVQRILDKKVITGNRQDESQASYSIWRNNDDYKIDWNQSSSAIERFIDAVGRPYSGAITTLSTGEIIRVFKVEQIEDIVCELRHVGKVVFVDSGMPVVICGEGLLKITRANMVGPLQKNFLPVKNFRLKFC